MKKFDKDYILNEIRRTAQNNGNSPLGIIRFSQDTGIKSSDWLGKYWRNWSDAVIEAGFQPNDLKKAYRKDIVIAKIVDLTRSLGRFPTAVDFVMEARKNKNFPSKGAIYRLGKKQKIAQDVIEYCASHPGYEAVYALCTPVAVQRNRDLQDNVTIPSDLETVVKAGYVYMALLVIDRAKRYKIGKTVFVERRVGQISIHLPENLELVHTIQTDDAYGIEHYWHRRFEKKRTNGEWFSLSHTDVESFKRRKFM